MVSRKLFKRQKYILIVVIHCLLSFFCDLCDMETVIELDTIELWGYHGCYKQEQLVGNRYAIDVKLIVDASRAVATDDVKEALNYVEVYQVVKEQMAITQHLVESVVNNIVVELRRCFFDKGLKGGVVRVAKLAPPVGGQMKSVSVSMNI